MAPLGFPSLFKAAIPLSLSYLIKRRPASTRNFMASAQSILMQKPSFAWENHSHLSPQTQNYFSRTQLTNLSVNCFFMTNNNNNSARVIQISLGKLETEQNPVEIVVMNMLRKPAVAALEMGLLLTCRQNSTLVASGGRISGSSFSTPSSPSRSRWRIYEEPRWGSRGGGGGEDDIHLLIFGTIVLAIGAYVLAKVANGKTTVLKLQVGLLGSGRSSLQKDLNWIAETADTSTSKGLHYVLTETVVALLRHPDDCISGYSLVDVNESREAGEKKFNQLCIEERGKFDEETLVNVNNIKKESSTIQRTDGFSNEYIVITILMVAGGEHKLPSINSSKDLKEALQNLASIPSTRTLAVEVLWTPQKEDDTLSELELQEDYPLLRPLQ